MPSVCALAAFSVFVAYMYLTDPKVVREMNGGIVLVFIWLVLCTVMEALNSSSEGDDQEPPPPG
jgi:hypothetical protein